MMREAAPGIFVDDEVIERVRYAPPYVYGTLVSLDNIAGDLVGMIFQSTPQDEARRRRTVLWCGKQVRHRGDIDLGDARAELLAEVDSGRHGEVWVTQGLR